MPVDEPESEAEWQLLGAGESAQWRFIRPRPADPPSPHVYIPNTAHISEEDLLSLLKPFGRVLGLHRSTSDTVHSGDSFANVTFATVVAAAAALDALDRKRLPETQGTLFRMFPSALQRERKVRESPPEAGRT